MAEFLGKKGKDGSRQTEGSKGEKTSLRPRRKEGASYSRGGWILKEEGGKLRERSEKERCGVTKKSNGSILKELGYAGIKELGAVRAQRGNFLSTDFRIRRKKEKEKSTKQEGKNKVGGREQDELPNYKESDIHQRFQE